MNRLVVVPLTLLAGLAGAIAAAGIVIYTGLYNVAADAPHTGLVFSVLETERLRAIAMRAKSVQVPDDLADAKRTRDGAPECAEMCSQCHLAPGMERTEIAQGLYPSAPEFSRGDRLSAAEQFWVVKHGIKFTSMPAWGPTHDDEIIWNIVAFVRHLPFLSPRQYRVLTANASEEHDEMMSRHNAMHGMKP